jgi:hypothetical protein
MKFKSTVELGGKTATGIEVPEHVIEKLAAGKRPALNVTVGGHTFRTTVGSMGGRCMIPLSAENRTAAVVAAGDAVQVTVELDTAPREVVVPADFAQALQADPEAKQFYDGLAPSHRKRWVTSIEDAKTDETRQRRIAKAIAELHAGRK